MLLLVCVCVIHQNSRFPNLTHEIHKTHVKISQRHNRKKKLKTKQNFKDEIMNNEIKKAAANNTNNTTATPPNQPTFRYIPPKLPQTNKTTTTTARTTAMQHVSCFLSSE
jgi:hypothetical protein